MTSNITKTNATLFSMLAISALLTVGFVGQHEAEAAISIFTWQIPEFSDWTKTDKVSTSRSSVSHMSTDLDEEGKAKLYAKDRSNVKFPQASVEYTKTITVKAGDKLDITQKTFVKKVSFYQQDSKKYSHLTAIPLIHKVGESSVVGHTNQSGCAGSPVFEEITSNVRNKQLTSTLQCHSLTPGDYEISAYVHARANENSSGQNASVSATVEDIELSIKRTRTK